MTFLTRSRVALAATALAASSIAAQAEEVIRAIHFAPAQVSFSKNFMTFVDKVNDRGEGVVRIEVLGGPETIPQERMAEAQRNGVVDMVLLAGGRFLEIIPEAEAFAGSNRTPMEVREDGGFELINELFHEKANAHLLAHVDGGAGFHVWLTEKPEIAEDGMLSLEGLRLRSSPLYRAFLEELGATLVVQASPEVYTSLERGVVDGTGYPIMGLRDFGWDKFLNYRIDPGFFQVDVLVTMNLDSWNNLSDEARDIVETVAIEHEASSYEANIEQTAAESEAMAENGMEVIELTGEQREAYLKTAYDIAWQRMAERDPANVDALKDVFFEEIE
ncbi:TRAP transporter substrate-binding protein DctP [Tropicimonas sp. IMCC34011]|uniref:TRAP transporter substrate-binding protein DctP n=1 Tax=Tropicimonas sp. IMCC34011 TaxID=2248759 RepID=UPI000E245603|nr:TRAP transporter substrate-binding protein DctP [Tropicimonas sp. IMCC34011]